jgi:hypothetical protein
LAQLRTLSLKCGSGKLWKKIEMADWPFWDLHRQGYKWV